MARLSYPAKFALISASALVVIVWLAVGHLGATNQAASVASRELEGLQTLQPALKAVTLIQQHRGMTSAALGGDASMQGQLGAKAGEVTAALSGIDEELKRHAYNAGTMEQWTRIGESWNALRTDGAKLGQAENFAAHTRLVDMVLRFVGKVADDSGLSLDPEANTYYLIMLSSSTGPALAERLGRLRGMGAGILARKELPDMVKTEVLRNLGELDAFYGNLNDQISLAQDADPELAGKLQELHKALQAEIASVRDTVQMEILDQRFLMAPPEYFALASKPIARLVKDVDETFIPAVSQRLAARAQAGQTRVLMEVGLMVVVIGVLAWLQLGFFTAVKRSVRELSEGADQLAGGNLAFRIRFSAKDELSQVADRFNAMADSVAASIGATQRSAQGVAQAAHALADTSARIASSSSAQSSAAASMAAAVEELTVSIGEIGSNAHAAESNSVQNRDLSTEGAGVVGESVTEIEHIAQVVGDSALAIEDLGQQSQRINEIVSVIREIADQTNLLALNAAIEAARAGEQGRGFAVVADEVRKLAERTGKATEEIGNVVAGVREGTQRAVEAMQEGVAHVRSGVEKTLRAGKAMQRIQEGAETVTHAVRDISVAISEQNAAATSISQSVERVAQMAEENDAAIAQASSTARQLTTLSSELQAAVARFRLR
ncbi:methyl-accepting chemotaxis protein [Uliginosibacterium sp. H1]|uniref:methyl-accepting chemotaxis protein n=1 Tax=Uliginosibacterium sp. H1 TaxID=3114757 RepID=UPI002E186DE3|nr:methyl-accepting chemotaxis protein [Uliginosibacterium sp. H1]